MRLSSFLILLVGAALTSGCGNDIEDSTATYDKVLRWTQQPGEIQDCHVFKLDNSRHVEINRLQVKFPEGSHHVHIYRTSAPEADAVTDCFKGIDWQKWSLLVGAQTKSMDWQLPEGVTIALEPHQQLLAQVHWLNSTPEPIQPKVEISFQSTDYSEQHLGVLFGVNQRINLLPGTDVRVDHWCPVPEGSSLHAVMGHFHTRGHDYKVTERQQNETTGKIIYEAKDEPTFDFKLYNPAHQIAPKAGLEYSCGFFNSTGSPIGWGSDTQTQEHCNVTAYYAPAEEHKPSLCLLPASKLTALTPQETSVRAGGEFAFAVEIAEVETTDVSVAITVSDDTALEVPSTVVIPAGEKQGFFLGRARRPAPVDISASLSGATVTTRVQVTGLVISELFYQSATGGSADQLQWIEIANQTDSAIDLSKYSLGAGTTNFTTTKVALPMMIPARGCIVVGGPDSNPVNHLPFIDLKLDLVPDLGNGGMQAEGLALFASSMADISTSRPLDVLVYAGSNSNLRGPDGQIAPVWPGSDPGGSLRRITDKVWAKSSAPTPGNCEVLGAH